MNRKLLIAAACIIAAMGIGVTTYCSGYEYGDQYALDRHGNKIVDQGFKEVESSLFFPENILEYKISNRWPKWSPFYREKCGLINIKTGEVGEPKYRDYLHFGYDELAWDYEGHLVDPDGNIIVDHIAALGDDRFLDNPRKFAFFALGNRLKGHLLKGDFFSNGVFDIPQILQDSDHLQATNHTLYIGNYAANGLASFYSDNQFGYMNLDGEIVIPAIFGDVKMFDDNGFAIVYCGIYSREYQGYGLINADGDFIVEPNCESMEYYGDGYKFYDEHHVGYVDSKGNVTIED
ncbi:WG repeat-containing protein [Butyrivibrio sp. JL13D10]|uniref:WG repeat-containing protein n=1 Tax=Butyrivibrio sp. JL13D10 TaxID=3236815 RepID=UPI0038B4E1A1